MAVTAETFSFRHNFRELKAEVITQAISDISVLYSGITDLWSTLDATTQQAKQDLLTSLLVAWQLADLYPEQTEGVVSNGGMPLSSKEASGVVLKFLPVKVQESMYPLFTNTFGIRALNMIMSAPERFSIRGDKGFYAPPIPAGYYGSYI